MSELKTKLFQISELKNKYIEVFKSKIEGFNSQEYEDYKQRFNYVLEESLNTKPNIVVMSLTSKEVESNTLKFFLKELNSSGIDFKLVKTNIKDHYQIMFEFNINKV